MKQKAKIGKGTLRYYDAETQKCHTFPIMYRYASRNKGGYVVIYALLDDFVVV